MTNYNPHADYRSQAAGQFGGPAAQQVSEHSQITRLPGEETLFAGDFTSSPILRHIKTGLVVTGSRVVVRYPQYMFFLIKVGYAESSTTIPQICEVTTGRLLSRRRVMSALMFGFGGLFLLTSGMSAMGDFFGVLMTLAAILCLAVAAFQAWMARSLGLTLSHTGGGALHVDVDKLEFAEMNTAGTLIQRLIIGAPMSPAPRAPATVVTPVVPPAPTPRTPAPSPTAGQAAPPSIWRG